MWLSKLDSGKSASESEIAYAIKDSLYQSKFSLFSLPFFSLKMTWKKSLKKTSTRLDENIHKVLTRPTQLESSQLETCHPSPLDSDGV